MKAASRRGSGSDLGRQGGVMSGHPGRRTRHQGLARIVPLTLILVLGAGCATPARAPSGSPLSSGADIRIGAVFPLMSNAGDLAKEELAGVQAAADFVNADGGVDGRRIVLDVHDLEPGGDAAAVMAELKAEGAAVVVGAYSSDLSITASQAANDAGLVYWEAGAVADRLTGRGLPLVFRVGASGTNLGSNSAAFAATELAPRLEKTPSQLRIAIVSANDDYASSVADAAASTARSAGTPIVARATYDLTVPDWPAVMAQLETARPDVVILASHIPDGVAFRRAMLASGLHVGALIGSTMAECDPDFAGDLGQDAVGIFASDRPTGGFQPSRSTPRTGPLRPIRGRLGSACRRVTATSGEYGTSLPERRRPPEYTITGPIEAGRADAGPTEEGLSGFAAAWALFHDVLPDRRCAAARRRRSRSRQPPARSTCRPGRSRTAPGSGSPAIRRPSARTSGPPRSSGSGRPSGRTSSSGRRRMRPARSRSCRLADDGDRACDPVSHRPVRSSRPPACGSPSACAGRRPSRGPPTRSRSGSVFGRRPARRRRARRWRGRAALARVASPRGRRGWRGPRRLALATRSGRHPLGSHRPPFGPWAPPRSSWPPPRRRSSAASCSTRSTRPRRGAVAVIVTSRPVRAHPRAAVRLARRAARLGVGLWLAGLRLATGGVAAPAIAHTVADLATWWL